MRPSPGLPVSQYLHRYRRTGFRIGQGVVVLPQVEAAPRRDSMQLMVRQLPAEDPA